MGTIVTYPREKFKNGQPSFADMKDEQDREILARVLLENVRNWIDSDEEVMGNMAGGSSAAPPPVLTEEECAAMAEAGEGTMGHTCIIDDIADLDLYEKYMYPPLRMPKKPQLMVSYWDMNNKPVNFIEGRIMVKALCPDGIESWLVINVPVPNFYTAVEGNCWGWPKYVCDEMNVAKEHSDCIYEGKPSLTLDFSPGGLDDATIQELKENGTEMGNTVSFHIPTMSVGKNTLLRQGSGPSDVGKGLYYAEWDAGMIKVWGRPEDQWSALLPENCEVPGVWQRTIRTGAHQGGGMRKVKEHNN